MSVIEVNHLTKDYGFGRGVFDVSFWVEKGEVFGFLGPNGAGKSTTIRHLMGFSQPDSGSTKLLGKDSFSHWVYSGRDCPSSRIDWLGVHPHDAGYVRYP